MLATFRTLPLCCCSYSAGVTGCKLTRRCLRYQKAVKLRSSTKGDKSMPEAPVFFLPDSTPDSEEVGYARLAALCGSAVPSPDKRIYSITYSHDGIEWTATVGKSLSGTSRKIVRRRGQRVEQTKSHSDPATVRAIFAGVPYMVVTDGVRTQWANPFFGR